MVIVKQVNAYLTHASLADFSRLRVLPEYISCTDKLQQKSTNTRTMGSKMLFYPCPLKFRTADTELLEKLRCDLLQLEQQPAFLNMNTTTAIVIEIM